MEKIIKNKAVELGFDLVGITDASSISRDHIAYLKNWLAVGCAADMAYMHNNLEKRINPTLLMDGAKSIICVALNYKNEQPAQSSILANCGRTASYACFEDYHNFIKQRMYLLADFIKSIAVNTFKVKVCVDSAPVAERFLAARAGLGFIAKNHMLTHPVFGQQILLGELVTNLELQPDQPLTEKCSGCSECIKACPTGALSLDGNFDSRKCISYLTIEHKHMIPQELAKKIGNRFFGCDECVLACPYHKNAPPSLNKDFKFYKNRELLDLNKIMSMDEEEFKKCFADSPILRLGLERAKRNAAACLLNAQGARKLSSAEVGTSTPR